MTGDEQNRIARILAQRTTPSVVRPPKGKLEVRLPYAEGNKGWLTTGHRTRGDVKWHVQGKYWITPASWFFELARRLVQRHGAAYILQKHNEMEKCAPACWNAKGLDCNCSCMGERHGSGDPEGRWYVVSETFAFTWQGASYRATLLTAKPGLTDANGTPS